MTGGRRVLSEAEDGDGIVCRHIRSHATRNKPPTLVVKNQPECACSKVLFGTVYGGDEVPQTTEVSALVSIERTLFVLFGRLVQNVDQHRPVFNVVMKLAGMGLLTVFSILRVTLICEKTI